MIEYAGPFPETIPDLLGWRAALCSAPNRPWLKFESDSWTLLDVMRVVDRAAVGLAERGVTKGDVVAILIGNRPETIFTWLAANQLGAIAMPLNPAYKAHEVRGVVDLVKPRVFVVSDELLGAQTTTTFDDLVGAGSRAPRAEIEPDDVAVLLATSGTTGAPKAVMQTHRTYALTAEAFPAWIGGLDERDRMLCTLPLFHVNAQAYATMGALGSGAGLSLVTKFSASRFWDEVRTHEATHVNAVGAMIHILLSSPPTPRDRDHRLRVVYSALALSEETHRAFEERFGVRMTVGYGLSETTFGTVWPAVGGSSPPYGTMGVLRQHPRLGEINFGRVVDDEGRELTRGETGELLLSNPAMMRGYFGDDAQTRACLFVEGDRTWFRTGDLVRQDPLTKAFTFVSRKKEVLRRRGENVAAAEIERILASHPAVLEAAVIGVPSALGEDEIVGFVTLRADHGEALSDVEAELRPFVRAHLADYKVPSRVHVLRAFPRTATERIAKHLLREPDNHGKE